MGAGLHGDTCSAINHNIGTTEDLGEVHDTSAMELYSDSCLWTRYQIRETHNQCAVYFGYPRRCDTRPLNESMS